MESAIPGNDIIGMGPIARISIRPDAPLLNGVVGECLAAGVLAVPDSLWGPIGEADHVVLPVWSVLFDASHFRLSPYQSPM